MQSDKSDSKNVFESLSKDFSRKEFQTTENSLEYKPNIHDSAYLLCESK